jgi:hypothetical protein
MVLQALASSLARLPLFRSAAEAVAELLERCADDSAARRHGTRPLLRVLLTLAGSHHMGCVVTAEKTTLRRSSRSSKGHVDPASTAVCLTVTPGLLGLTDTLDDRLPDIDHRAADRDHDVPRHPPSAVSDTWYAQNLSDGWLSVTAEQWPPLSSATAVARPS